MEFVKRDETTIHEEDENSNTPLHLAAFSGQAKTVRALIDAGADIESRWDASDVIICKYDSNNFQMMLWWSGGHQGLGQDHWVTWVMVTSTEYSAFML